MSNEKIQIIKDQGGRYLLPSKSEIYNVFSNTYHSQVKRFVNGIELPGSTYSRVPIQIPYPENITIKREYSELVKYQTKNGDKVLLVHEYNDALTSLRINAIYDDGEWEFDNIDNEYEYKKFIQTYEKIYEQKVEERVFTDFEFIETIVSEHEDITPVESIINNPEDMLFVLTPTTKTVLTEVANKLGYTFYEDKEYNRLKESEKLRTISVSNHSNYEYTKINGTYIGSEIKDKLKTIRPLRGTYDECLLEKERQIKLVYDLLKPYDDRLNEKKLSQETVGDMLTFLSSIGSRLNRLDVKKLDVSTQRAILTSINTKINELTNS
jgi:hypothetical protein